MRERRTWYAQPDAEWSGRNGVTACGASRRARDSNPQGIAPSGFQVYSDPLRLVASRCVCSRSRPNLLRLFASSCTYYAAEYAQDLPIFPAAVDRVGVSMFAFQQTLRVLRRAPVVRVKPEEQPARAVPPPFTPTGVGGPHEGVSRARAWFCARSVSLRLGWCGRAIRATMFQRQGGPPGHEAEVL